MRNALRSAPIALVSLALALTGCAGGATEGDTTAADAGVTATKIAVGGSFPRTGVVSGSCVPIVDGAQAWIDQVNAEGGVHGRTIEIEALDDAYQAPRALKNAKTLSQKPVFAYFNACGSIAAPSIQQVAKPAGIPFLFPGVGETSTTEGENFFTVMPSYAEQFAGLIPWVWKNEGNGSAVLINTKLPDSEATADLVEKSVTDAGGKFLGTETVSVGEPDFSPIVLKLKAKSPDYVIFNGSPDDGAKLFRALGEQGAMPPKKFVATAPLAYADFIAETTEHDEKLVISLPTVPWGDPAAAECEEAFAAHDPAVQSTGWSLFACASAQLLVQTLQDTGKDLDRDKVVETVLGYSEKSFSPMMAPVTFSKDEHTGLTEMFVVTNVDGGLETVSTFPLAAAK